MSSLRFFLCFCCSSQVFGSGIHDSVLPDGEIITVGAKRFRCV